ncbi:MAG: DNA methyltransferase, partial [Candidatus Hermodarchaeota archaeon]
MQKQTKKVNFSREKPFNDLERMHKSFCEERELNTEFYKLFHETRLMLIKEFQDKGANKHKAVYYAQILLKRLLIIFFAEDLSKLKIKFRNMILESLENSSISNESTIIADTIKNLFLHLARDYQDSIINIDGLFEEKIPKSIYFKDLREFYDFNVSNLRSKLRKERKSDGYIEIILSKYSHLNPIIINLLNIAFYDFNSEIKINILGYIFEKSISDLEEIFDDKIHRRKKKGVFYTPQYITDYICRNTIIQYLSNEGANTITDLIYEYCENIDELQKKIEKIRILDPACGSGVFLIKTVEIFLEILREIEKVKQSKSIKIVKISKREKPQKVVLEETISYGKAVRKILENNIFGLDINKESIQVTKLSLGLKIIK